MSDQITCVCGTEFEGNAAKLVRIRLEQFAKKMVAILMAAILAGCGGGGGASTPAPTPPPPASVTQPVVPDALVVFMGDSITAHWGESSWQITGDPLYTMPNADLLSTLAPDSLDVGIPGQTTDEMLARFQTDVVAHNPKTVVIEGGTNDMYLEDSPNTGSIVAMIIQAQAAGITVVLGLVPPTNNWGAIHYSGATGNDAIIAWNMQLTGIAASYGVKVADYYTALTANGQEITADFYVDGVHPIGAGYAAMWAVLSKELAP